MEPCGPPQVIRRHMLFRGTAEHPGTVAEQPNITRNTSVTPQNNGTLQNKEQLQCF